MGNRTRGASVQYGPPDKKDTSAEHRADRLASLEEASRGSGGAHPPGRPPSGGSQDNDDAPGSGEGGALSSEFLQAAWDKTQVTFVADGKEIAHTSGIAAESKLVDQHGHNSRFSTWTVRDAATGQKLGKTTTVTTPAGEVFKRSNGWTGTKNGFNDVFE